MIYNMGQGGSGSAGYVLTGTLTAGQTILTFTDSKITDTCLIDVYTDVFNIYPVDIAQSGTTLTLTFNAQETNLSVKVIIKEG